jgi:hypothetical protein
MMFKISARITRAGAAEPAWEHSIEANYATGADVALAIADMGNAVADALNDVGRRRGPVSHGELNEPPPGWAGTGYQGKP